MIDSSRRGFLAACVGVLGAGCSARGPDGRATDGGTAATRETPRVSVTPTSTDGVQTEWDTFVPGQYSLTSPTLSDDRLFLGSREEIRALDLADGAVLWETPLDALTHAFATAVSDGTVVAGARDIVGGRLLHNGPGTVAALDTATGTLEWETSVRITGSPAVSEDGVLVPTVDDSGVHLTAIAWADGSVRWQAPLEGPGGTALAKPVVAHGLVVAASARQDGAGITAIDIADGTEEWRIDLSGRADGAPAIHDGTIYVGTTDGRLHALSLDDGAHHWRTALAGPIRTSPGVTGETVLAAVADTVRAVGRTEGRKRWQTEVGQVSRTGLSVAGRRVYVGGNRVSALTTDSGETRWVQSLPGLAGTFGAPVSRDGIVYTGACIKTDGDDPYDHHVYALRETV